MATAELALTETFTDSLANLQPAEQAQAMGFYTQFRRDPSQLGISLERLKGDDTLWSGVVETELRTETKTVVVPRFVETPLFAHHTKDYLFSLGVPEAALPALLEVRRRLPRRPGAGAQGAAGGGGGGPRRGAGRRAAAAVRGHDPGARRAHGHVVGRAEPVPGGADGGAAAMTGPVLRGVLRGPVMTCAAGSIVRALRPAGPGPGGRRLRRRAGGARARADVHGVGSGAVRAGLRLRRAAALVGRGAAVRAPLQARRGPLPPVRHRPRRRGLHHGDLPNRPPQRRSRPRRVPDQARHPRDGRSDGGSLRPAPSPNHEGGGACPGRDGVGWCQRR